MPEAPPSGSFVWTMFPFGPPDRPDEPGPVRHIGYVVIVNSKPAVPMLLMAYTSSGAWRGGAGRLPRGVVEFDEAAAGRLGQRPFHLDLRCLARLPLLPRWFPDLTAPGRGVVGRADAALRDRIDGLLDELMQRDRALIELRGPR